MDSDNLQPGSGPSEPPAPERLESWKELSAYLKRDVRTLRRWEKNEALPVHRHMHDKLSTVYSYKHELDAWWNNRRPRLEQQERVRQVSGRRRLGWAIAAAAVVVAAVAGGIALWQAHPPALPFAERDWVLVTSFENRTGEAALDGTLEYALERELSNSRFVNVVSRQRIEDVLRLMKKPPETKVDAKLGREICLRDGGIRALLTGRVEKLDSTYVLSAGLTNPAEGVTVSSFSEEAAGEKGLVPAVRRLSSRVRETLGEQLRLIRQSEQKLAKATTPSLRALQHYSRGVALVHYENVSKEWGSATELLQQAVAEDPEFPSAHIWLAHSLHNIGKYEEAKLHYERAFELADTTTDRERYFILGSYYMRHLGDNEKAAQAFEVLLQLYPDHYWGLEKLAQVYTLLARQPGGARYRMRLADLRPNHMGSNWTAFRAVGVGEGNLERARPYLLRARKLAGLPPGRERPGAPWLRFTTVAEYWQQGHMEKVFSEVTRFEQIAGSGSEPNPDEWAALVGSAYLALGKIKLAEEWTHSPLTQEPIIWRMYSLALFRGDRQALGELAGRLKKFERSRPTWRTMFLLRAGLLSEAEAAISDLENRDNISSNRKGFIKQMRGELALARGNTGQAIALLEEAIELRGAFRFFSAGGSESLARAWEQQGNVPRAIRVLEAVRPFKTRYVFPRAAPEWMKTQLMLAQLYRKVGRERAAREIEAELRKLLVYADPDHPILVELAGAQEVALLQPPT